MNVESIRENCECVSLVTSQEDLKVGGKEGERQGKAERRRQRGEREAWSGRQRGGEEEGHGWCWW